MNMNAAIKMVLVVAMATATMNTFSEVNDAEVVVQAFANSSVGDSCKNGSFFNLRSLLCREAFANALTNLAAQTGRNEDSLRGATICGIDEGVTNGVYTLKLDVVWSAEREDAACRILAAKRAANVADYVLSDGDKPSFATWIGPKQVRDSAGAFHFLGFSATEIGRNKVVSRRNIRRAQIDAQAMAARAFMGRDRKMADVKARFHEVFRLQSRHPLCSDLDMFVCGYEVVSLEFPAK